MLIDFILAIFGCRTLAKTWNDPPQVPRDEDIFKIVAFIIISKVIVFIVILLSPVRQHYYIFGDNVLFSSSSDSVLKISV